MVHVAVDLRKSLFLYDAQSLERTESNTTWCANSSCIPSGSIAMKLSRLRTFKETPQIYVEQ
jgi:hypothetical protein